MIRLTWLGHATCVIDLDGVRLVTDPLLSRRAGPLRRRGPTPAPDSYAGSQAVLLSHLHHDHAEVSSLRRLPGATVVTGSGNAPWVLSRTALPTVGLEPGAWVDPVTGEPASRADGAAKVVVALAPASHGGRPMPHRPNAATGHLVVGPSGRVWFAGDTERFDGLDTIRDLVGGAIDLALVPIAGWGPKLGPGHLDPADAARVCSLVGAAVAIPVHWGTFFPPTAKRDAAWITRPLGEFEAALAEHAPATRLVALAPGESAELSFDDDPPAAR